MNVPASCSKDLEDMGEDANFVEVAHLDLMLLSITCAGSVYPVELVTDTFAVEFFDNSDGFLSDSSLSLLSAGTTMMSTIDTRVGSKSMLPVVLLFHSRLATVDICADPEVGAGLELCKKSLLVDDITT